MFLNNLPIKYRLNLLTTILIFGIFFVFFVTVMSITYIYEERGLTSRLHQEMDELKDLGKLQSESDINKREDLIREIKEIYRNNSMSVRVYTENHLLYQYGITDLQTINYLGRRLRTKTRESTQESIEDISVLGSHFKTLTIRFKQGAEPVFVELWILKSEINPYLITMAGITMFALLLVFIISIPLTLLFSRTISVPIERLNREISNIYSNNLKEAISFYPSTRDEIGQLILTINALNSRLHGSFEELRQFSSQLSHEIRTPLSLMLNQLASIENEAVRLQFRKKIFRIINLLESAKLLHILKEGIYPLERSFIRVRYMLDTLIEEVITQPATESCQIVIDTDTNDNIEVDEHLFAMALKNILENAVRYGDPEKEITIAFHENTLSISNRGKIENIQLLRKLLMGIEKNEQDYKYNGLRLITSILKAHELQFTYHIRENSVSFLLTFPSI